MSWYTVGTGRHDAIYSRVNGAKYAPSLCTLPEGNYSTVYLRMLCVMLCMITIQSQVLPSIALFHVFGLFENRIGLKEIDAFEILTDKQVLHLSAEKQQIIMHIHILYAL